jgi:hypothetical protein
MIWCQFWLFKGALLPAGYFLIHPPALYAEGAEHDFRVAMMGLGYQLFYNTVKREDILRRCPQNPIICRDRSLGVLLCYIPTAAYML